MLNSFRQKGCDDKSICSAYLSVCNNHMLSWFYLFNRESLASFASVNCLWVLNRFKHLKIIASHFRMFLALLSNSR